MTGHDPHGKFQGVLDMYIYIYVYIYIFIYINMYTYHITSYHVYLNMYIYIYTYLYLPLSLYLLSKSSITPWCYLGSLQLSASALFEPRCPRCLSSRRSRSGMAPSGVRPLTSGQAGSHGWHVDGHVLCRVPASRDQLGLQVN